LPTHQFPEDLQSEANQRKVELESILVQSSGEDMITLKGMLAADKLKPHVSKVFRFENMADAHLQIESGRTVGKIVVTL
jgi:NADPH:quinone reductase-like Zn-dependent oxidoreductase